MRDDLGLHETLELHELVTFKSLCLTKASIMQVLVSDENLKNIMKQDVDMHDRHIGDLKGYLN